MKKNYLIGLIVSIIIVISLIISFICFKTGNNEKKCTNCDYVYDLAATYIKEEIKSTNPNKYKSNFMTFVSYDTFGVTEDKKYKYAYMWILDDSYYKEDGKLEFAGGSSMFYKIKLENDKVVDYEIPMDGGEYTKSIKKMCFDNEMYKKVINYKSNLNNDEVIKEYYSNIK